MNKRDHNIYLRDKQNLEPRLVRKQYENQPDSMFKDSPICYQIADRIPDPTAAGDFLRRFDETRICALQETFNETRAKVWALQDASFRKEAIIDIGGMIRITPQIRILVALEAVDSRKGSAAVAADLRIAIKIHLGLTF